MQTCTGQYFNAILYIWNKTPSLIVDCTQTESRNNIALQMYRCAIMWFWWRKLNDSNHITTSSNTKSHSNIASLISLTSDWIVVPVCMNVLNHDYSFLHFEYNICELKQPLAQCEGHTAATIDDMSISLNKEWIIWYVMLSKNMLLWLSCQWIVTMSQLITNKTQRNAIHSIMTVQGSIRIRFIVDICLNYMRDCCWTVDMSHLQWSWSSFIEIFQLCRHVAHKTLR